MGVCPLDRARVSQKPRRGQGNVVNTILQRTKRLAREIPLVHRLAQRLWWYYTGTRRYRIGRKYLRGNGIEIGALHNPLRVGRGVTVSYVDRLTRDELVAEYPEMHEFHDRFVNVEVVDDGETLHRFPDASLDFVIANHMLEHCENPLGTLRNHLLKLRVGGVLYYAIPEKTRSFDVDRPLTSFEHLVRDDQEGPKRSREAHYLEFVRCTSKHTWMSGEISGGADQESEAARLMRDRYSIHFHVWDTSSFAEFLVRARVYLDHCFEVKCVVRNSDEVVAVLQKTSG